MTARFDRLAVGLLALAAISLTAACSRTIRPGHIEDSPLPPPNSPVPGRVAISATISGLATVQGSVRGSAFGPISTASPQWNTSARAEKGIAGDERKECKSGGTVSQARADASVSPLLHAERGFYSVSLASNALAFGGSYETKKLGGLFCSGHHATSSAATAKSEATIYFAYNPEAQARDQLLLSVTGSEAAAAAITIRGPRGTEAPKLQLPNGGIAVDIAQPGTYVLTTGIAANASARDDCRAARCRATASTTLAVGIQSLRDALREGLGRPDLGSSRFSMIAFSSDTELQALLAEKLFTNDGRFYPCAPPNECAKRAANLFLEQPRLHFAGGTLVVEARLNGCVNTILFFCTKVSGAIRAFGTPFADGTHVGARSVQLEVVSRNLLVQLAGPAVLESLQRKLGDGLILDATKAVDRAKAKVNEIFPIRYAGNICLVARLADIRFEEMEVHVSPPGLAARLSALVESGTPEECAAQQVAGTRAFVQWPQGTPVTNTSGELLAILREDLGLPRRSDRN